MWDLIVSVPDHCLSFYFVTLKQRILKRHSSSYWPNVGIGDIEKF